VSTGDDSSVYVLTAWLFLLPPSFPQGPQPIGWCHPHLGWVFPLCFVVHMPVDSGNLSQTHPEVCLAYLLDVSQLSQARLTITRGSQGSSPDSIKITCRFLLISITAQPSHTDTLTEVKQYPCPGSLKCTPYTHPSCRANLECPAPKPILLSKLL
jgi:hypothetical protein